MTEKNARGIVESAQGALDAYRSGKPEELLDNCDSIVDGLITEIERSWEEANIASIALKTAEDEIARLNRRSPK